MMRSSLLPGVVAVAASVILPVYILLYLQPAFTSLLRENASREAGRLAGLISSLLVPEDETLTQANVPQLLRRRLGDLERDSNIRKLTVFTRGGEIVYSTDPREIGRFNTKEYFNRLEERRGPRSLQALRDPAAPERHTASADVVEIAVPIVRGSRTLGVVEIFIDITEDRRRIQALLLRSTLLLSVLASILLAATIMAARRAGLTMIEQRKAEAAQAESEQRYRSLFEHAGDAIFLLEATGPAAGRIVSANQAAADMHGYTLQELTSLRITDLDTPDAASRAGGMINRILDGEWIKEELTHRRKNGSVFPVEVSAGRVDAGGKAYVLAIDRDITKRRGIEVSREKLIQELQAALENIRTLKGLLPICASCKKIRDDGGYWNQIEAYLRSHTQADFSHSLCPDCAAALFPKFGSSGDGSAGEPLQKKKDVTS